MTRFSFHLLKHMTINTGILSTNILFWMEFKYMVIYRVFVLLACALVFCMLFVVVLLWNARFWLICDEFLFLILFVYE